MSRGPDTATRLERTLLDGAAAAGLEATVTDAASTRWASATFTGARHRLQLTAAPSPRLAGWLAGLPEHEFALPGHLVADLIVTRSQRTGDAVTVEIEVLTVEER